MKRFILILMMNFIICHVIAQYSFELTHGVPEMNDGTGFTLEKDGYYYSFGNRTNHITNTQVPLVLKISADGLLIQESSFFKQDTMYGFHYAHPKPNGNFLVLGYLKHYQDSRHNIIYACELTSNLEIVWERMDAIPFDSPYSGIEMENTLITPDGLILLQGKFTLEQYGSSNFVFFTKYDLNGNQVDFVSYQNCVDHNNGSTLFYDVDSTAFFLIGILTHDIAYRSYIKFDLDLIVIESGEFENNTSFLFDPISAVRLSSGNAILANRSTEITGSDYSDLEMRLYDENYNLLKDTIINHDERVSIPSYRGLDYVNEDNIWVATFERMWATGIMGSEVFRLFVFDKQLKLKGRKVFGGDTRYWFWDLLATSDGGCILTGNVPEYEGSDFADSYFIKIMPDDILTEVSEYKFNKKTLVFPLPANDVLNIKNLKKDSELIIYDLVGKQLVSYKLNKGDNIVKLDLIKSGTYIGVISQDGSVFEIHKIMKK